MLLLLLPSAVSAFFFPSSGGGCACSCAPAPVCPQLPTCAIPAPCPDYSTWVPAVPGIPAQPVPQPTYQASSFVGNYPAPLVFPEAPPTTGCGSSGVAVAPGGGCGSAPVALPAAYPAVQAIPASYQAPASVAPAPIYLPAPSSSFVLQPSQYEVPQVQPVAAQPVVVPEETTDDKIIEVVAQPTVMPTLIPPIEPSSSYDDTAPALPPPVPPAPSIPEYKPEYKTSETIIPTSDYQSGYAPRAEAQYDESTGIHSGDTSSYPPFGRAVSTEGIMEPLNAYNRRNMILKRMRNVRTMGAVIPHTNATCNSHKLANIMARAIVPDVSVAKRMVMRSAELAFDGAKFDVFCATGEFSYSIHSRKYCEVTRDDVTCFAFR